MKQLYFLLIFLLCMNSCAERDLDVEYISKVPTEEVDDGDNDNNDNDNDDDDNDNGDGNNGGDGNDDDDDDNDGGGGNAQGEVIVGGSLICGSSITSFVPARYNGFGANSWSAVIYKASDLSAASSGGTIEAISYLIDCKSEECEADEVDNQVIYMRHVTQDEFTTTTLPDLSQMTKVFDDEIEWERGTTIEDSWNEIELDTPFQYDGSSNIMIYFENKNNAPVGGILSCVGETPSFLWDNIGDNRSIHATFNSNPSNPVSTPVIDNITPVTRFTFGNGNDDDDDDDDD